MWKDAATPTVAQAADAALKKKEIGVPEQQLFEDLGYSPVQIERFRAMRRQAAADGAVLDIEKLVAS